MESAASQAKGNSSCSSKASRKQAASQRQSAATSATATMAATVRDESGSRGKESNSAISGGSNNCSDEENNEENSSGVAVASSVAAVKQTTAVVSNNRRNAKSSNSNSISSSVSNNGSNAKNSNKVSNAGKVSPAAAATATTNDAKVVGKATSTESSKAVSSDTGKANDVGCNNARVANNNNNNNNNKHTSNESNSSRSAGHGRSSKGGSNKSTNDLSKVAGNNGKSVTNELSYSKVTSNSYKAPKNEMSYSDIVSSSSNSSSSNGNSRSNGYENGNAYKVSNDHHNGIANSHNNAKVSSNRQSTNNEKNGGHHKREVLAGNNHQQHHNNNSSSNAAVVATNNSINKASSGDGKPAKSKTAVTTTTTPPPPPATIDPEAQQRRAVLSYEQVCRLNDVMNEVVSIHGRGNFPTLEVKLRDLVTVVRTKLEADPSSGGAGMRVRDIRLNGGAASHVLATESQPYNDLDLIFGVELSSGRNYDKIKAAVLSSLYELLPEGVSRTRITTCSLKEAYVSKMVKVNNGDGDRWSLISLGNSRGHRNVELKFVDSMRRQFEFSVDSFQIVLDALLTCEASKRAEQQLNEVDCPSVVGESVYGDFHEALYHLQKKLISTRHPEEIRGGGLLKYCNLLVKMYKAAQPDYIKTLERYMCSRFFIDFPDIGQQKAKLENYLWNHFVGPEEEALKYQYLMLLHSVVEESTVCLMGHERRQTLALIDGLAYQVLCQEQQQRLQQHHQQTAASHQAQPPPPPPAAYVYANGYYYAPVIPACYTCTCNSWMACSS